MIPWCISIISKCSLCLIHSINYCGINNMFPCSHRAEVESRHHHSLTTRSLQLPLSWLGTYSEGSTWFSPLTRVPSYSGCYKSCSLFRWATICVPRGGGGGGIWSVNMTDSHTWPCYNPPPLAPYQPLPQHTTNLYREKMHWGQH